MQPTTDIKNPNIPKQTNFLGIVIDTKNGSKNPKIKKALDKSYHLLDIMEFIKVTKFKLNMVMFDYFWQVVAGNTRVHLHPSILEWCGYDGEVKEQRKNFIRMLKRNHIDYIELTQKDEEIEIYPTIQKELKLLPSNVKHTKFLIMEPDDIKMAIMQLKTKNGYIIRQYYIDLEKLLKLYTEYTLYFNHRESQREITDLRKMIMQLNYDNQKQTQYMRSLGISLEEVKDQNEVLIDDNKEVKRKLGIAVEDRAPLPADEKKQERFVLIKRNDPFYIPYYTIRAQNEYTSRKIRSQRMLFPNLEILLDFKANPNSKTLYVRIKDKLKSKGVTFDGNNIDLNAVISEEDLIEEMNGINDSKRDI
jgi:hypothetical protein